MIYEFVGPTAAPFDRTPSLRAFPARYIVRRPGLSSIASCFILQSQKTCQEVKHVNFFSNTEK